MVIQKSFERQHFGFEASDVVKFIATHKDLHSIILVFEIIARIDCLWILNLLLQGDKIDADR